MGKNAGSTEENSSSRLLFPGSAGLPSHAKSKSLSNVAFYCPIKMSDLRRLLLLTTVPEGACGISKGEGAIPFPVLMMRTDFLFLFGFFLWIWHDF